VVSVSDSKKIRFLKSRNLSSTGLMDSRSAEKGPFEYASMSNMIANGEL
jgi:hypothetical protein